MRAADNNTVAGEISILFTITLLRFESQAARKTPDNGDAPLRERIFFSPRARVMYSQWYRSTINANFVNNIYPLFDTFIDIKFQSEQRSIDVRS